MAKTETRQSTLESRLEKAQAIFDKKKDQASADPARRLARRRLKRAQRRLAVVKSTTARTAKADKKSE